MKAIVLKTEIPGPKSRAILERRRQCVAAGVAVGKTAICALEAQGALVTDVDGNCFIDLTGGLGCMNAGHSAPRVLEAAADQLYRLQHTCFQVTMYEPYIELAERLSQIVPGPGPKKACFFNSGAEAVENAIKIARRFSGRQAVVCFEHAFHGRTLLTMSLTSKVKPYKDGFGPFAPEVYHARFPYTFYRPSGLSEEQYIEEAITDFHRFLKAVVTPDRIAAIILEPVMGEGGFIICPPRFATDVQWVCAEHGIVLIADEIQTGFARTGRMFACEHFDLKPDLVTLAKSLSNGFPLSAVVGRSDIMDSVPAGGLGGTFGGNPIACAAALAVIETVTRDRLCERSEKIGLRVKESLAALARQSSCIGEVRGLGAMVAWEVVKNGRQPDRQTAERIAVQCGRKGVLVLTAGLEGNVLRMLMPLCITDEQLDEALKVLGEVIISV
jgi:4-aminobutyrate aminotransferase/(S)-3-amino-2-methylpropionate transaminase